MVSDVVLWCFMCFSEARERMLILHKSEGQKGKRHNFLKTKSVEVAMKKGMVFLALALLVIVNLVAFSQSVKKWDGGGGNNLWTTSANWNPDGVPTSSDDVILDNTYVSGNYDVIIPHDSTLGKAICRTIQIGYSGNTNTIRLILFSNAVVNALKFGDGTAGNDDFIIEQGGVFINASNATTGTTYISRNSSSDIFKVKNGGKYVHVTGRSFTNPFSSSNSFFEPGSTAEFNVRGGGSVLLAISGRNFGNYIVSGDSSYPSKISYSVTGTLDWSIANLIVRAKFEIRLNAPSGTIGNVTVQNDTLIISHNAQAISITGNINIAGSGALLDVYRNINLNGTSTQTISGTGTFRIDSLTINNSNGVVLGLSVIDTNLIFVNGKLTTGSNAIKVVGSISGAGAGKFVDGNLVYPISSTGSKKWETGQGSDYLPATINFTSLSGSGDVTVSVLDRTSTSPGGPIGDNKVLKRFFRINQSGLTSLNADLTLTYTDADVSDQGISDENSLRVFQWDGAQWRELTVTARNTTDNTITVTGVTSFSDFVISGTGDAPLPVQVTKVSAEVTRNVVKLRIKTQVESSEFLGFEIYRSIDNVNYVLAGSYLNNSGLKSKGGEMFGGEYEFVDKEITGSGKVYYKIEAVSKNERSLIDVVEVEIEVPKNYVLHQNYPNPFNPATTIEFEIPVGGNVVLELYNSAGQKVMDIFSGELPAGYHKIRFDGSNLASGVYFYVLRVNGFVGVKKMVLVK
jgi:hypothetical protein